jgi:hypothetical protein
MMLERTTVVAVLVVTGGALPPTQAVAVMVEQVAKAEMVVMVLLALPILRLEQAVAVA